LHTMAADITPLAVNQKYLAKDRAPLPN
jgi:hypothetical protein